LPLVARAIARDTAGKNFSSVRGERFEHLNLFKIHKTDLIGAKTANLPPRSEGAASAAGSGRASGAPGTGK